MSRRFVLCLFALALPAMARADSFDHYINTVLTKVAAADGVKELKELTPALITDNDRVLKDATGALIVVKTNNERYCKLLVQAARQKIDKERSLRMLLVERFVTYRDGTEQAIQAAGQHVSLFPGFRFNLDLGQVVPDEMPADLRFVVDGDKVFVEPLKDAKLYLVTKPIPEAAPKKTDKLVVGEAFEARYFNGTFKLHNDGRRSGKLTLKVEENNEVTGSFVSDKDGQSYEVKGKIGGAQPHAIQFTITFPRIEESFSGWLFTGDAKVLTGTSRLGEREAGFYAVRVENE